MKIMIFFFKQKTAYEMRISDWSSDVCSSDLIEGRSDAQALIELMQQALTRPFALKLGESGDAIEVEVGASFGLAMFPRDGDNEHQLISCADARMYAAKNARQA